jgi:hypothetical protein
MPSSPPPKYQRPASAATPTIHQRSRPATRSSTASRRRCGAPGDSSARQRVADLRRRDREQDGDHQLAARVEPVEEQERAAIGDDEEQGNADDVDGHRDEECCRMAADSRQRVGAVRQPTQRTAQGPLSCSADQRDDRKHQKRVAERRQSLQVGQEVECLLGIAGKVGEGGARGSESR